MGIIGVTTRCHAPHRHDLIFAWTSGAESTCSSSPSACWLGRDRQYIRGEFLVLRKRPFIESARAVGLRGASIAVRHILPNILPQLIVLALLEMGQC